MSAHPHLINPRFSLALLLSTKKVAAPLNPHTDASTQRNSKSKTKQINLISCLKYQLDVVSCFVWDYLRESEKEGLYNFYLLQLHAHVSCHSTPCESSDHFSHGLTRSNEFSFVSLMWILFYRWAMRENILCQLNNVNCDIIQSSRYSSSQRKRDGEWSQLSELDGDSPFNSARRYSLPDYS